MLGNSGGKGGKIAGLELPNMSMWKVLFLYFSQLPAPAAGFFPSFCDFLESCFPYCKLSPLEGRGYKGLRTEDLGLRTRDSGLGQEKNKWADGEKFHVDVLFTKYERETYGSERWQIKCQDEGVF